MNNFNWELPYPSVRQPIFANNLVATSQPLAVQAGLSILGSGGNAVDAALATAITLTVVEPNNNGIGSDAFALIWDGKKLHGLNASGRSPEKLKVEHFNGQTRMPRLGWLAVTVPGAVSAWMALSDRFGKLPFGDLFQAAIGYAEKGYQVGPKTAYYWKLAETVYQDYDAFKDTFLSSGKAPGPGDLVRLPDHAKTLTAIANSNGSEFYSGILAQQMVHDAQIHNAPLSLDDLSKHRPEWVSPLHQDFGAYQLHEIPPNGQGIMALIALAIVNRCAIHKYPIDSADSIHLQVEAIRCAYGVIERHLADPDYMKLSNAELLDPVQIEAHYRQIDLHYTAGAGHGLGASPDTVYLTTADADGMMVSFIQSNYRGFGSGIVIPGTGISMQNRGSGFVLEKGHPNQVGGGKRPYHTIIPAFVTCANKPALSFGVMGGHMQAQGHLQMMVRLYAYGQNPQAASDAPRWQVTESGELALEKGFDSSVKQQLIEKGHKTRADSPEHLFGGAQLIAKLSNGYCGASDHRKEGLASGY